MAAPVVTRPPTTVEETAPVGGLNMEVVSQWARWVVVACVVLGAVGLISVAVVSYNDKAKSERARQTWDELFKAMKDKNKPEQMMSALEGLAEKVSGTPTHAYVLMELGDMHFKDATNPAKSVEDRAASLKKSEAIFETVATQEPYASNPAFGPVAVEGLALGLEQEQKYDKAISLIEESLPKLESHFMRNKLAAQLGRLYYLRSLVRDNPADKEKDRVAAREKLTDVLRQAGDQEQGKWREHAEFIKSIIDKPGKALKDGVVPPAKIPVAPPVGGAGPAEKPAEKKDVPAVKTEGTETKPEVKKDAPEKKDEPKKDDKDAKKDEKKTGSIELKGASEHISFAQIQQALKEGRTAFCQCPRCGVPGADKEAKARLVE